MTSPGAQEDLDGQGDKDGIQHGVRVWHEPCDWLHLDKGSDVVVVVVVVVVFVVVAVVVVVVVSAVMSVVVGIASGVEVLLMLHNECC